MILDKCECYHEYFNGRQECWGTKECDMCTCEGDPSKCNFYLEKRRKSNKTMNTAEMYIEANKVNNKNNIYFASGTTYTYNQKYGFVFEPNEWDVRDINSFMALEWRIDNRIAMTKDVAEAKYNIKIID